MRQQGNYSLCGAIVLCASVAVSWAADNPPPAGAPQAAIESPAALEAKPVSPPDARTQGSRFAVVDLSKVFQDSQELQARQNELRVDVERARERLHAQKEELKAREEKLAALSSDDPGYEALAEEIAIETAQLQAGIARQKLQFANRDAKIYRDIFVKCKQAIERWALAHHAALVLQVAASDDDESTNAIRAELAKTVLYHHGIEITADIIRSVNGPGDSRESETPTEAVDATAPVTHGPPGIATLDLQKVFSVDAAFRQESDELQADVKDSEKALGAEKARLAEREQALEQLDKNGEEYRREEARLVEQKAALTVLVNRQKATFSRREADIYLARYREIQRALTHVTEARGLALVLQVNDSVLSDHATPDEIRAELSKLILYHRGADVTNEVIGTLNKAEGSTSAKQPTAVPNSTATDNSRSQIATLDLWKAISENDGFKLATEQLKTDIAEAEKALTAQKQQLQQDSEKLQKLKQGSEDYRDNEHRIIAQEATLRGTVSRQKRDFAYREAEMYFAAYRETASAVADLSAEKGLRLVLQFHDEAHEGDDANGIKAELGKVVLYQRGIDVTDDVIERVANRAKDAR